MQLHVRIHIRLIPENVDGEEITSKKLMSKVSLQKFVKPDAMVIPDEDEGDGD